MKNQQLLQTTKTMLATVAITGMLAGVSARLQASPTGATQMTSVQGQLADTTNSDKHDCKGLNSCKGQGGCKTSDNGCKGLNSCKGKGGCKTNSPA